MTHSTLITMKGTTTIPKEVRKDLGLKQGDRIRFQKNQDGDYVLKKELTLEEVREMNRPYVEKVPTPSVEELKKIIHEGRAKEAVERYRRSLS